MFMNSELQGGMSVLYYYNIVLTRPVSFRSSSYYIVAPIVIDQVSYLEYIPLHTSSLTYIAYICYTYHNYLFFSNFPGEVLKELSEISFSFFNNQTGSHQTTIPNIAHYFVFNQVSY